MKTMRIGGPTHPPTAGKCLDNERVDPDRKCVRALAGTQLLGIGLFTYGWHRTGFDPYVQAWWLATLLFVAVWFDFAFYYLTTLRVEEEFIFHLRALPCPASWLEILLRWVAGFLLVVWSMVGPAGRPQDPSTFALLMLGMQACFVIWDITILWGTSEKRKPGDEQVAKLRQLLREAVRKWPWGFLYADVCALVGTLGLFWASRVQPGSETKGFLVGLALGMFLVAFILARGLPNLGGLVERLLHRDSLR